MKLFRIPEIDNLFFNNFTVFPLVLPQGQNSMFSDFAPWTVAKLFSYFYIVLYFEKVKIILRRSMGQNPKTSKFAPGAKLEGIRYEFFFDMEKTLFKI